MNEREIITHDHHQIIASVWAEIPPEHKEAMFEAIRETVMERREGTLPLNDVVETAWASGFHCCMCMMENNSLIKAGPVRPEEN